jgi:predicted nucleic acid-binding protein
LIVADCNLIAYLVLAGSRTAVAEAVFQRESVWAAPLLWRSEFRNVLATQVRVARLPVDDALLKMTEAENVMAGQEYAVVSDEVLEECARSGISAYDAEYVVVARTLKVPFLTHDRRVLGAGTGLAQTPEDFLATA